MKNAPRQIITSHINTDFDALASIIGATLLYPGSIGVVPKMVNKNVSRFLSTHKSAFDLILPNEIDPEKVEKLIVVDTDQWQRLDRMEKLRERNIEIEVWDHHIHNIGNIEAGVIRKENVGATITLLCREMQARKITLSPLQSTVMLIGLYEDTGRLSFPATTPEDAMTAAYLLKNGADLNVASFFLAPPYEEEQKDILFEMLKSTEKEHINGRKIGFNIVHLKKVTPNLAGVVSSYRGFINVAAVFVIFVSDSYCTVIARSGSKAIDVGLILQEFGGGGHPGAGSATIRGEDCDGKKIRSIIREKLKNNSNHHVQIADIMSFPVVSVPPTMPMRKVREIMDEKNIRGIIVAEDDQIEGVVVLCDFKKIKKENQWNSPVKAFMTRGVTTITPDTPPSIAAEIMSDQGIGYLPVVHENKMIGIVTRTDVIRYIYGLVPE
ncbi:CBS domain-containing protein [Desulfotalea psychrophila]|uniref:CBS domain-containing protein n=1 Tax=Desulfotalea psychrophila (strain LSv54 / DSM 12343) TaxID=177439 RepID=Q6AS17_DESPS|nr:CBS domain-containing protein [Desulfotalea psychrophila]CAG34858.1 hypothetical protein DP0129 [Desulfotalea psychrophila LSv54]